VESTGARPRPDLISAPCRDGGGIFPFKGSTGSAARLEDGSRAGREDGDLVAAVAPAAHAVRLC
jgi:hypothetical protein